MSKVNSITPCFQTFSMKKKLGSSSYSASLDRLLFIFGVGHMAPDTYSGYGSLLDSDNDGDDEVTSASSLEPNTVPDTLAKEVSACVEEIGKYMLRKWMHVLRKVVHLLIVE
ncbi:hypothetical protein RND81_04G084300 [Saponaria officinalis]|uniref:Uncharacterized protein n=1 Tax=Saponaria officinalis TaxID=3572 RepID=A0AAW1LK82_SAPOF